MRAPPLPLPTCMCLCILPIPRPITHTPNMRPCSHRAASYGPMATWLLMHACMHPYFILHTAFEIVHACMQAASRLACWRLAPPRRGCWRWPSTPSASSSRTTRCPGACLGCTPCGGVGISPHSAARACIHTRCLSVLRTRHSPRHHAWRWHKRLACMHAYALPHSVRQVRACMHGPPILHPPRCIIMRGLRICLWPPPGLDERRTACWATRRAISSRATCWACP